MAFFPEWGWIFDLCTYFRFQYLVLAILSFCLSALSRNKFLTYLSVFLILLNSVEIYRVVDSAVSIPAKLEAMETPPLKLKILVLNVLTVNRRYEPIIEYIQSKNPDLIALLEINQRWLQALGGILEEYPYQLHRARQNNFGIGLFSKIKPAEFQIQEFTWAKTPGIRAYFSTDSSRLVLHLTHTVPPISSLYWNLRNEHLNELAQSINSEPGIHMVFGDLNLPPYSGFFRSFLEKSGLRLGLGETIPTGTWPTGMPFLMSPVDHVLLDTSQQLRKWEIGPDMGSDHLPIFFEVDTLKNH
jgi:endonuclease/exonuclease/phosphatase (EEP) superfamily protein YafD